jgi:ATP-dependent helicase HrpA
MEAKIRRRDVLVDEQVMVDFYLARLPEHVHSISALERWLKEGERRMADGGRREEQNRKDRDSAGSSPSAVRRPLFTSPREWMQRDVPEITADSHPDTFVVSGNPLPLEYRFEPGTEADGITMMIPTPLLSEIDQKELSWLIPGWRLELITELLRSLPKHARKHFVPVPEYAARALAEINPRGSFYAAMAEWIGREGIVIGEQELAGLPLSDHLRFNLRVIAVDGTTVGQSRDPTALRRAVRMREIDGGAKQVKPATYRSWDFEPLPLEHVVERRGLKFTVYPTLRDLGDSIEVAEARSRAEADDLLRRAVLRLAILACPEQFRYARKRFNDHRELILLSRGIDLARPLPDGLATKCFEQAFLDGVTKLPRNAQEFAELLNARRGTFGDVVDRVLAHTLATLQELRSARQKLEALSADTFAAIREFVGAQIKGFAPEDFPTGVPALLWPHLPRYLKAVSRRLDKAPGNLKRDAELASRVAPGLRAYRELAANADDTTPHPELDRLQWMIEELRVSIFAQDLGVATPASEKRVAEQVERAKAEAK